MQNSTVVTVMMLETSSEFQIARPRGWASQALRMLRHSPPPGVSGGGNWFISDIGLLAATTM